MRSQLKFAAVVLPLLVMLGCQSGSAPAVERTDKYAPQQVSFASQDLADSIAIGKIERTFDAAGIMHLTVPVRAVTEMGLTVDYRVTYFDDNRNPVDVPTGWSTKSLTPGIVEYFQATGSDSKARDFQIDFRWPVYTH